MTNVFPVHTSLNKCLNLTAPKNTVFLWCVCADSSLCRECVSQRCRVLRLKNQLNEDYKEVSNLVKRSLR